MDEQLDIKMKATLSEAITEFNKLNNTALTFANTIQKTNTQFDNYGNPKKIINTLTDINNKANKIKITSNGAGELIGKSFTSASKKGSDLRTVLSTAFDVNRLYFYWNLTKRVRDGIKNLVSSSIDYVETQNKFNVSMGQAKPQATKFVNTMSEAIGIAKAELMDYQSTFKNIISGLGSFTDIQSEKISESLSKMALDYSSLYNVGQSDAMEKFQSALVGSIRPIRSDSGYDVSETTIGAKAKEIGLDRSVNQLNQMEKRMLRIIVLMDQMKRTGAMNDLARTIEQPANQLRVLKAQLQETGVWLGNVFMGTLGQILPYINGFVMALKEIFKMLALFTGYVADDTNLSEVFESVQESSSGVSSNIGSANKKAKELKKTLMGFDVLNVINKQTESKGAGGGVSGGSSIDPKILKSLQDYESTMEKVRMKATEIRDIILDWLGVTDGTNDNLKKIWDIAKIIGLVFASWKIASGVLSFFDKLGLLDKLVGNKFKLGFGIAFAIGGLYAQYKGTERLLNGDVDIFSILETIGGTAGGAIGISAIIGALKTGKAIPLKNRLAIGFDIMLLVQSVQISVDAIKDIKNGEIKGGLLKGLGASLEVGIGTKALLGLSLSASAVLTFDIMGVFFLLAAQEVGKKTLTGYLTEKYLPEEISSMIQISIGIGKITWSGLEKILPEETINKLWKAMLKRVITNIATWIRNIPVIGKSMSDAIMLGIEASEREVSNTIQYTSEEAMRDANPWVKKDGEKLGRDSATSYSSGFSSEKDTITTKNTSTIKDSLSQTKENTKSDAFNLGTTLNTRTNEGYSAEKENTRKTIENTVRDGITDSQANINKKANSSGSETGKNWGSGLEEEKEHIKRISETIGNTSGLSGGTSYNKSFQTNALKNKLSLSSLIGTTTDWEKKGLSSSKAFWNNWTNGKVSVSTTEDGGAKLRVQPYSLKANGGPVSIGEMFVAREAGPELVGSIGNTTTVMNNDQIVQSVSRGVAQAVASVLGGKQSGGEYRFYLDGQELTARVEQRLARNANVYGTT